MLITIIVHFKPISMKNRHNTRRDFLKTVGVGALSSALPLSILNAKPKERLGVALVGLGYYSTDILAVALEHTKHCYLAGIVTGSPEKAKKWQAKYKISDKNIYNYQNFDQIANNPDIDVVYVVLPPSMHREYVERAAKAGKHVWCEKPMAPTVADCKAMIKACEDNKVTLAIGYRLHHEANTQQIMKNVKDKTFGKTQMVSVAAGYYDGRTNHWKQNKALGGGVMGDMGVYAIQGARYSVGEEPIAVTAHHYTQRPDVYKEVDETTTFILEFPGGAVANCVTSYGMNMNYLQATCEKGWFKLDPFSAYSGVGGSSSAGIIPYSTSSQQIDQMNDDAFAILNKKPLMVTGEEGLRDIRVVEAVYKSAKLGTRVKV
jgi:glucose-fructose oxidoreductase